MEKSKNKKIVEENKERIKASIILTILSIIYIILVKTIDVRIIGPNDSSVGFACTNMFFANLFSGNMVIYKITEILGIFAILIAGCYAIIGFMQLIKRKSLLKVDRNIIAVGILYVLVILCYILFEKFIINYRPILIDGELEASFPSSHTMLAICVCISAITLNKTYIKNNDRRKIINISILVLMGLIILGRLISGVHWFTDILGGLIISSTLLSYFYLIYYYPQKKSKK